LHANLYNLLLKYPVVDLLLTVSSS